MTPISTNPRSLKGSGGSANQRGETTTDILRRVAKLEAEVARIKRDERARNTKSPAPTEWWRELAGRFDGDPIFAEVVREGRKWRRSQRPRLTQAATRSNGKR
jgi:hypothetical protein